MLNVLLIDDMPDSLEPVLGELKKTIPDAQAKVENFREAKKLLKSLWPDIVVLDIYRGQVAEEDTAGLPVHELIWNECFCPIVVYSALLDNVAKAIEKHPFVELVEKGSGSESLVVSHIEAFRPHVEALNAVQSNVRQHVNRELKSTAPRVFDIIEDTDKRRDVFVRAAKRRIAAMMDEPYSGQIMCWEQYLYPPVGSSLLTGDVIRKTSGDRNNPADHLVVLSPSCDLESIPGEREANIKKVLVASCSHIKNALGRTYAKPCDPGRC